MTVYFWEKAEKFYEFWVFIAGISLCVIIIWLIFIISYRSGKKLKKSILIMIAIITAIVGTSLFKHNKYRPYLEQARYTNPLIRDREPRLLTYVYYGQAEQLYYTQLNDLDSLRKMALYNETQVSEPIVYLGEGTNSHYFEHSNGDLFRHTMNLEFKEGIEQSRIVGSRFHLKDDSFESIGFKNPQNIMFDYIEIPASEKGKKYTPENERQFLRMEKVIKGWNF